MKKLNFLNKLKSEGTLKIVEISDEISKSYLIKSEKCIRVAKLAFDAAIYENAISEAYYSIYNVVTALFLQMRHKVRKPFGGSDSDKATF